MSDNTPVEITGQVEISDVLKILDDGVNEADSEAKGYIETEDLESAIITQHTKITLLWAKRQIIKLERKP